MALELGNQVVPRDVRQSLHQGVQAIVLLGQKDVEEELAGGVRQGDHLEVAQVGIREIPAGHHIGNLFPGTVGFEEIVLPRELAVEHRIPVAALPSRLEIQGVHQKGGRIRVDVVQHRVDEAFGIPPGPSVHLLEHLRLVVERHAGRGGVIILPKHLSEGLLQRILVRHQDGVGHFERNVQVHGGQLLNQNARIGVQGAHSLVTVSEHVKHLLQRLSFGSVRGHRERQLQAQRRAYKAPLVFL